MVADDGQRPLRIRCCLSWPRQVYSCLQSLSSRECTLVLTLLAFVFFLNYMISCSYEYIHRNFTDQSLEQYSEYLKELVQVANQRKMRKFLTT